MVNDAVAPPDRIGSKIKSTEQEDPAARLAPQLLLNRNDAASGPVSDKPLIPRLAPPTFVTVTLCAGLSVLRLRLPKLRLVAERDTAGPSPVPVPVNAID